jgi:hypothetical protein
MSEYITPEEWQRLLTISREVRKKNASAEKRLRAKCRWEHMSRTAVINEWGDPRKWKN